MLSFSLFSSSFDKITLPVPVLKAEYASVPPHHS